MEVKINKSVSPLYKQEEWNYQDLWPHTNQIWWMAVCFQTCHSVLPQSWPESFCGVIQAICILFICCSVPLPKLSSGALPEGQAEVWWMLWEWFSAVGHLHTWALQNWDSHGSLPAQLYFSIFWCVPWVTDNMLSPIYCFQLALLF